VVAVDRRVVSEVAEGSLQGEVADETVKAVEEVAT
jgi:hypothetical protein